MPPKRVLLCCSWDCGVEPKSEGVVVVWFCCVLVFPNKDGVVDVCCVDAPLEDAVSSISAKDSLVRTRAMASLAVLRRTILQMVLALPMCSLPMRLRKDRRLLAPTTGRSTSQRGRRWRAQLQRVCSCC